MASDGAGEIIKAFTAGLDHEYHRGFMDAVEFFLRWDERSNTFKLRRTETEYSPFVIADLADGALKHGGVR